MVQQKLYFSGINLSCMSQQTIISATTQLYICVCVCYKQARGFSPATSSLYICMLTYIYTNFCEISHYMVSEQHHVLATFTHRLIP